MKRTEIAYFLWMFGGLFGLHLIYLGRFRHATCVLTTFGGFFGFSFFYDFFMIPSYVREANFSKDYQEQLLSLKTARPKAAPFSFPKFVAQIIVGNIWGSVFLIAVPEEEVFGLNLGFLSFLAPAVCALGVHTAGNTGRDKGQLKWPLLCAYLPLLSLQFSFSDAIFFESLAAAIGFQLLSRQWNVDRPEGFTMRKFATFLLALTLCNGIWFSYFYFNASMIDESTSERIKLRDALKHFFNSPFWKDLKQGIWEFADILRTSGWKDAGKFLSVRIDPSGLHHAYEVFNVTENASGEEIKQRWRELSREWHPDKHNEEVAKEVAKTKFIEIKEAYDILTKTKRFRTRD